MVNITPNSDDTFSTDKTFDEIVQAYNEGKYNIVAHVATKGIFIIPLLEIHVHSVLFGGTIDDHIGIIGFLSFIITDNNEVQIVTAPLATLDSKLPNPNALTFTGAVTGSYDGSRAKTIEIPIGAAGKSAYQYAVEGGYADTEANFYADLAAMQGLASALATI